MPIRLGAFDLDGTLIRGQNSLAVIGAALRHPEWEHRIEILYMRGATPDEMGTRVAPWRTFSTEELCRPLRQRYRSPRGPTCLSPSAPRDVRGAPLDYGEASGALLPG